MAYTRTLVANWYLTEKKQHAAEFFNNLKTVMIATPLAVIGVILSHAFIMMNGPFLQIGTGLLQNSF